MTADIRTAAERGHVEAHKECCGGKGYCRECFESWPCPASSEGRNAFPLGAVWAAKRVTPSDEQIAEVVYAHNLDELLLGNGSEWLWYTAACSCGWRSEQYEFPGDAHKIHAAHVAAHVSKLMAGLAEGERS